MINEIKQATKERMEKTIEALNEHFNRIRTGRASPSILDGVMVEYYGSLAPLKQVANINVEDARTLAISVWEKAMVGDIEKAIMKSDLGLNPASAGTVIRVPMPALTEETRKQMIRQARNEAENARISLRNARRDAHSDFKDMAKEKMISEDEARRAQDDIQKITDQFVAVVDETLKGKETDLMVI